ncbi:MAG: polymer-forming cytoskeletal protein [Alphaproteobacteria bacterium]|nr:polymer-forming cytoskeletal protein [Alphaproteobacteria bacterium]
MALGPKDTGGRREPDLSFLQRTPSRALNIPNLSSAGDGDLRPSGNDGKTLIVGRDIALTGEITACDILVVEGSVKAALPQGRHIEIARTGSYDGDVSIESATVAGSFEGELTVRDLLRVTGTGHVRGKVRYGRLEVEVGGVINGDIATIDRDQG